MSFPQHFEKRGCEQPRAAIITGMISGIPSFQSDEVALLVSAVEKTLEHLRHANEHSGENDTELLSTDQVRLLLEGV